MLHIIVECWPNSRIPDKLFWQIQDDHGKWLNVSRLHAFFSESDNSLSALMFEYGTGQNSRQAGCIQGTRASIHIGNGERVTQMDVSVGIDDDEIIVSRLHLALEVSTSPMLTIAVLHEYE